MGRRDERGCDTVSCRVRPEHAPTLERYLHLGRQLFTEQFLPRSGDTSEIPEFRRFDCRFLVLCSSRSGSELLCYLLRDFGAATAESMSFLPDVGADLQRRGVSTLREALVSLCHQAPAAVLSAKGTGMTMPPLLIYDELPAHRDEWRFVILQRRDVLAQAVSLAIAEQTGVWRSVRGPRRQPARGERSGRRLPRADPPE